MDEKFETVFYQVQKIVCWPQKILLRTSITFFFSIDFTKRCRFLQLILSLKMYVLIIHFPKSNFLKLHFSNIKWKWQNCWVPVYSQVDKSRYKDLVVANFDVNFDFDNLNVNQTPTTPIASESFILYKKLPLVSLASPKIILTNFVDCLDKSTGIYCRKYIYLFTRGLKMLPP